MGILRNDGAVSDVEAFSSPAVIAAHDAAVERGDAGYADPVTGLFVMTAAYLIARGTCCGNGCRHCPFG